MDTYFASSLPSLNHIYGKDGPGSSYHPVILPRPNGYSHPKLYTSTVEDHVEYLSKAKKLSEIALEYYNKKHGTHYELVEVLHCHHFFCDELWVHCNFKAKDRTFPGEGSEGSSIKLFFSEIKKKSTDGHNYAAQSCSILDGVKQRLGCARCHEHIIHPNAGFRKGAYHRNEERVRSLRPRPFKRFLVKSIPCHDFFYFPLGRLWSSQLLFSLHTQLTLGGSS